MALLEIKDLSRSFGRTKALAGANLSLARGEIVALMGANGAGKSTLVKILSGVLAADGGSITLAGRPYHAATPAAAAASGVVTVHQSTDLIGVPGLTVADALMLQDYVAGRQPFFLSRSKINEAARQMLVAVGLQIDPAQDFGTLGAADRQLVAIARALAMKAEVLILDEPTASLSGTEAERLYELLLSLREQGIGILYISHRTQDLRALADRVVILRGGQVVGEAHKPIDFEAALSLMIGRDVTAPPLIAREVDRQSPSLSLRGIVLRQGAKPFDLDLYPGEVVAISGVLGAGKSRLLGTIFGLTPPVAGQMTLMGHAYAPQSPQQAIAAGVYMAGEDHHRTSLIPADWPGDSIADTIALPHLRRWFPTFIRRKRLLSRAEAQIEALRIKAAGPEASVWSLSGGNQQKVVLARWEAEPASVLLLDEPFQGIDVGARADIIRAIRGDRSRATLIATSDPEEAAAVADRILTLDHHHLTAAPLPEGV